MVKVKKMIKNFAALTFSPGDAAAAQDDILKHTGLICYHQARKLNSQKQNTTN